MLFFSPKLTGSEFCSTISRLPRWEGKFEMRRGLGTGALGRSIPGRLPAELRRRRSKIGKKDRQIGGPIETLFAGAGMRKPSMGEKALEG